jgi:hypothetical protein
MNKHIVKHIVNKHIVKHIVKTYREVRTNEQTYRETVKAWFGLVWFGLVWFGLVWFGLVGFSFNANLEPQPRARRRARLAEDAPARNAFWTGRARPNPGTACAA